MKKIFNYLNLFLLGIMCLNLSACSDDSEDERGEEVSIKVFSPTRVVAGETVTITGTALSKVNAVVFLDDNRVTDIQVINENQIQVKAPSTLTETSGKLALEADGQRITADSDIHIVMPKITAYTPAGIIKAGDELQLVGTDLEHISEIVFPGNHVVKAMDFNRKSMNQLRVNVPDAIPNYTGELTLITTGGNSFTSPIMYFQEKPNGEWVDEEITVWEGQLEVQWGAGLNVKLAWFNDLQVGDLLTFHFHKSENASEFMLKMNTGEWTEVSIPELSDGDGQTLVVGDSDMTQFSFAMYANLLNPWFVSGDSWGNGDAMIITGTGIILDRLTWTHKVWKEVE